MSSRYAASIAALLAGASLPSGAFAQTGPAPVARPPANVTEPQVEENVGDIVVTAQRREERLRDVPLSVTAINGAALAAAGIVNTADLALVTPGLRIDATGNTIQPTIRGISTTLSEASSESAVATYLDGVYQQSTFSAVFELPDVKQIEVLKGPQGTLFGRNATGGAILIQTLAPDLDRATGTASVSYGSFNEIIAKAYVSAPIVRDRLAVSLTGYYHYDAGWKHNLLDNGQNDHFKDYLFRGKVRFQPADGVDFTLTGLYNHQRNNSELALSNYNGNNILQNVPGLSPRIASKPFQYATSTYQYTTNRGEQVSLHGDIDAGPGRISTTTAYVHSHPVQNFSLSNGPDGLTNGATGPAFSHNFEQELLYTTNQLGRFHGTLGAFYYDAKAGQDLDILDHVEDIYYQDNTRAYAFFGELTLDVTDRLSLTGGLRYNNDTIHAYNTTTFGPVPKPTLPPLGHHTFADTTPRATLLYKATSRTNFYASYSQGFKSGAYNSVGAQPTPVSPEKVRAYEVGVKSSEVRNLTVNLAGFYYDYTDLQVVSFHSDPATGLVEQTLENAARARIYGAELGLVWTVSHAFDVSLGGTYLHAKYRSFPDASTELPTPGLAGGNTPTAIDASGLTLIRSPKLSANLTGTYKRDTGIGSFDASGTVFYSSKVAFDVAHRIEQPAYALVNLTLGWKPSPDSPLRLSLYGRNLTNHTYLTVLISTANFDAVDYGRPRSVGGEISYRF